MNSINIILCYENLKIILNKFNSYCQAKIVNKNYIRFIYFKQLVKKNAYILPLVKFFFFRLVIFKKRKSKLFLSNED